MRNNIFQNKLKISYRFLTHPYIFEPSLCMLLLEKVIKIFSNRIKKKKSLFLGRHEKKKKRREDKSGKGESGKVVSSKYQFHNKLQKKYNKKREREKERKIKERENTHKLRRTKQSLALSPFQHPSTTDNTNNFILAH